MNATTKINKRIDELEDKVDENISNLETATKTNTEEILMIKKHFDDKDKKIKELEDKINADIRQTYLDTEKLKSLSQEMLMRFSRKEKKEGNPIL